MHPLQPPGDPAECPNLNKQRSPYTHKDAKFVTAKQRKTNTKIDERICHVDQRVDTKGMV